MQNQNETDQQVIIKLNKDLKALVGSMHKNEVRFLVDSYYQAQENRLRASGQIRSMTADKEPHAVLGWFSDNAESLENQVKLALKCYAESQPLGQWALEVVGLGPVLVAGLLAHFDITKAPTCGHYWSFAGQDPRVKWEKGQKRPWNAALKVIVWKIGESFVKVSNNPKSLYGRLYRERKEYEDKRNQAGANAERAAEILKEKKIDKKTDCYKWLTGEKGGKPMLPPAQIHARAKRYAAKMFISHFWECSYRLHYKTDPPKPFAIAQQGHAHYIEPEVKFLTNSME